MIDADFRGLLVFFQMFLQVSQLKPRLTQITHCPLVHVWTLVVSSGKPSNDPILQMGHVHAPQHVPTQSQTSDRIDRVHVLVKNQPDHILGYANFSTRHPHLDFKKWEALVDSWYDFHVSVDVSDFFGWSLFSTWSSVDLVGGRVAKDWPRKLSAGGVAVSVVFS